MRAFCCDCLQHAVKTRYNVAIGLQASVLLPHSSVTVMITVKTGLMKKTAVSDISTCLTSVLAF